MNKCLLTPDRSSLMHQSEITTEQPWSCLEEYGWGLPAAAEVTVVSPKSRPAWVQLNRLMGVSFRQLDFFQVWWLLWTSSRQHSLSNSGSHESLLPIHAWTGRSLVKPVSFRDFLSLWVISFLSLRTSSCAGWDVSSLPRTLRTFTSVPPMWEVLSQRKLIYLSLAEFFSVFGLFNF